MMVSMLNLEVRDQSGLEKSYNEASYRGLEGDEPRGMVTSREGFW